MAQEILVELDERRRTSFGKIGHSEHRRYLADVHPDGTIVLKPAHVVTEAQLRVWANPEIMERVEASILETEANPAAGNRTRGIPPRTR